MAFPPEFSSTLTYANRYDLDEINVFLEGDSNNPMFFSVDGLPNQLSFGKHYFNLSRLNSTNQEYELKPNSKILFEFKSINNVVLRSDVVKLNQRNGVTTCFVEVLNDPLRTYKEVEDGQGTLSVVASLQDKLGNKINMEKRMRNWNGIPPKFKDAMNYRCTFPIQIRKNLLNSDSPIITNVTHKKSTIRGQFSFVKASIPTRKYAKKGNTYNVEGGTSTGAAPTDDGDSPT